MAYFRIRASKDLLQKVSTIIIDDSTRGSKAWENILFQKFYDNFVIISFTWNDFYLLGHSPQQPICIGFQMS